MKSFIEATATLIVLFALAYGTVLDSKQKFGKIHELQVVGTVNGKTFLRENESYWSWTQAKNLCDSSGLELASIDSHDEIEFLRLKGNSSSSYRSFYWTSARDAQSPRQFSWDSTNSQPLENITLSWRFSVGDSFATCGKIYLGRADNNGYMYFTKCISSSFTLCQTKR